MEMLPQLKYTHFKTLSESEKVSLVDNFSTAIDLQTIPEKQLKRFLKALIEDTAENGYVRKKALDTLCQLTLAGFIKVHGTIDLLFDIEPTDDVFILKAQIKYLFLFYCDNEREVTEVLEILSYHEHSDVSSEAYYNLGLITFLEANSQKEVEHFLSDLGKAKDLFKKAALEVENRIDAQFFFYLCEFFYAAIEHDLKRVEHHFETLTSTLWYTHVFSMRERVPEFSFKFYTIINNIRQILRNNPEPWLDYKTGFNDLCALHYDLLNTEIANNLIENEYLSVFRDKALDVVVHPFYRLSFKAQLAKIDACIHELLPDEQAEYNFLSYLKELILEDVDKKKDSTTELIAKLHHAYPMIGVERIRHDVQHVSSQFDLLDLSLTYREETTGKQPDLITGTTQGDEIFNRIITKIQTLIKEPSIPKFQEFQGVLADLIRYTVLSTAQKSGYHDNFKFLYTSKAVERDLQDSLMFFLKVNSTRADKYSPERKNIADGGRVDILYNSDSITLPIELKKTDKPITSASIQENYLSQAQTYTYPYDQLGFFMLLDLNKKEKQTPINDIRALFDVMHLEPLHKINPNFPDYIVTIIVPGNKIVPSERSKYNA